MSNDRQDSFKAAEEKELMKESQPGRTDLDQASEEANDMAFSLALLRENWLVANNSYSSRP